MVSVWFKIPIARRVAASGFPRIACFTDATPWAICCALAPESATPLSVDVPEGLEELLLEPQAPMATSADAQKTT
jgi:hypothetical protein